jgi:hypothetical protein
VNSINWWGVAALVLGGATGSFHRAWRSPTQETWAQRTIFGCHLPSSKTSSDIFIGAICSVGIPKFGDLILPDFLGLHVGDLHPGAQWIIAHGIAFITSWELTVRSWILRERGREPEIKNSSVALPIVNLQPAKSAEEIRIEAARKRGG